MKTQNKKKHYVICDNTNNDNRPYITDNHENTGTIEGAIKFDSLEEANNYIKDNNWESWAYVNKI
jgi:hypothetical protein